MILGYFDDDGDYCLLGNDEQSFQEILNSAKVTGSADSICYGLNLKITAAELSPVEEFPLVQPVAPGRDIAGKNTFGGPGNTTTWLAHICNECIKPIRFVSCFPTGTNKTSYSKCGGHSKKNRRFQR